MQLSWERKFNSKEHRVTGVMKIKVRTKKLLEDAPGSTAFLCAFHLMTGHPFTIRLMMHTLNTTWKGQDVTNRIKWMKHAIWKSKERLWSVVPWNIYTYRWLSDEKVTNELLYNEIKVTHINKVEQKVWPILQLEKEHIFLWTCWCPKWKRYYLVNWPCHSNTRIYL